MLFSQKELHNIIIMIVLELDIMKTFSFVHCGRSKFGTICLHTLADFLHSPFNINYFSSAIIGTISDVVDTLEWVRRRKGSSQFTTMKRMLESLAAFSWHRQCRL